MARAARLDESAAVAPEIVRFKSGDVQGAGW
jgi:hypothetical protein